MNGSINKSMMQERTSSAAEYTNTSTNNGGFFLCPFSYSDPVRLTSVTSLDLSRAAILAMAFSLAILPEIIFPIALCCLQKSL